MPLGSPDYSSWPGGPRGRLAPFDLCPLTCAPTEAEAPGQRPLLPASGQGDRPLCQGAPARRTWAQQPCHARGPALRPSTQPPGDIGLRWLRASVQVSCTLSNKVKIVKIQSGGGQEVSAWMGPAGRESHGCRGGGTEGRAAGPQPALGCTFTPGASQHVGCPAIDQLCSRSAPASPRMWCHSAKSCPHVSQFSSPPSASGLPRAASCPQSCPLGTPRD